MSSELLGPGRNSTDYPINGYCEEGDDLLLSFLFQGVTAADHFFVEVGANHPAIENASYKLYLDGWGGLSIDANPQFSEEFARLRPRQKFSTALLSAEAKNFEYMRYEDHTLNSGDRLAWQKAEEDDEKVLGSSMVSSVSLTELLTAEGVSRVDLLSVNARSMDLEILEGFSFDTFSPEIVRAEMLYFNMRTPHSHPMFRFMEDRGYSLIIKTLRNGFWAKQGGVLCHRFPEEMF